MAYITNSLLDPHLHSFLREGGIGVIPTDTIYGVIALAHNRQAVERVYTVKGRDLDKPCIILVPDVQAITEFGIPRHEIARVAAHWPGPLSAIFSNIPAEYDYLRRHREAPPFRIPANKELREFLRHNGPVIAPSANKQGYTPAATIAEAQAVFGDAVDFYVDGGSLVGEPSTLVRVDESDRLTILRQGAALLD